MILISKYRIQMKPVSSIEKLGKKISWRVVNPYLVMNCCHLEVQLNFWFTYKNSRFDLVEFGSLNMIDPRIFLRIARTFQGISFEDVPKNWCTDFSTWCDFQTLIRTETLLSVHRVGGRTNYRNYENTRYQKICCNT